MKTFKNSRGDMVISLKPNVCILFYDGTFGFTQATAKDMKIVFGYEDAPEVLEGLNLAQKAFLAGIEAFMLSFKSEEERCNSINALLLYSLLNSVDVMKLLREVEYEEAESIASYICRMFRVHDITGDGYLDKVYWTFFNGKESEEFFNGIMVYFEK